MNWRRGHITTGIRVLIRQLTADPAPSSTIVASVLLCGLFLAATPLLFSQLADEALQEAVTEPRPQLRNVSASLSSVIGASTPEDRFGAVRRLGESFKDSQMPESVSAIVEDTTWVVESPQFTVTAMPGSDAGPEYTGNRWAGTLIRMRYQEDIDSHVSLVSGSMPLAHDAIEMELGPDCPATGFEDNDREVECETVHVPVIEVAVTSETLTFLGVDVGGMLFLTPDPDDGAFHNIATEDLDYQLVMKVSGLIVASDASADYWFNDPRLIRPRLRSNDDFTFVFASGLISPEAYGRVLRRTSPAHWNYEWRYFLDSDLILGSTIDQLSADLRNMQQEFPTSSFFGSNDMGVNTKLPSFIAGFVQRRNITLAMMSTSIAGLLTVAVALILMLSALTTESQRSNLVLLRNRGSSRVQMCTTRAVQGLILTMVPAVGALLLASWMISASSPTPSRLIAILVVAATAFYVLASASVLFGNLGRLQKLDVGVREAAGRRLTLEALVVVVALAAVVVVRRRGLVGVAGREPDVLLAITPVLLAAAVGVVVLRVFPRLVRGFAYFGSRAKGLILFVGFRRVLQQPFAARLPLLVMLMAVAVATFASVTRTSINSAQTEATWHETGAAFRLTEPDPGSALTGIPDFSSIGSFEAQAMGVRFPGALTRSTPEVPNSVDMLFIDVIDYAVVASGTPSDPNFGEFMTRAPSEGSGTESNPIPVIASTAWDGEPPTVGEVFRVSLRGSFVFVEVREVRDGIASMPLDRAVVIADLRHLGDLVRSGLSRPTVMYLRADADDAAAIAEVVKTQTFGTTLTSQSDLFDEIHGERFTSGLERSLVITFWLAALFATVAAVSALAMSARLRRRDFAYMRTLGLTGRQAGWLTLIEQIPAIVIAAVVGTSMGIVGVLVLEPAISLAGFAGGSEGVGTSIDFASVVVVAIALVVSLGLVTAGFGYVTRRDNLGTVLRVGDE